MSFRLTCCDCNVGFDGYRRTITRCPDCRHKRKLAYLRAFNRLHNESITARKREYARKHRAADHASHRRYRQRHREALKVAKCLGITVPAARALVQSS